MSPVTSRAAKIWRAQNLRRVARAVFETDPPLSSESSPRRSSRQRTRFFSSSSGSFGQNYPARTVASGDEGVSSTVALRAAANVGLHRAPCSHVMARVAVARDVTVSSVRHELHRALHGVYVAVSLASPARRVSWEARGAPTRSRPRRRATCRLARAKACLGRQRGSRRRCRVAVRS